VPAIHLSVLTGSLLSKLTVVNPPSLRLRFHSNSTIGQILDHVNTLGTPIRILLADDHAAMLAQSAQVLGERHQVVGSVTNGADLLEAAKESDPDLIVLDITMPGIDGFEAARRLKQAGCRSRLVFLTVHEDPDYAREAIALGADAYVVKSRIASDLMPAIEAALDGRRFVSPLAQP
jgi:DNA-binding NarL/FixJ family response regulator